MSRGRRAAFPPQSDTSDDNTAAAITVVDPRSFAVRIDTGSEFIVDLTAWSQTSFVAEIAPLLREHIRQMGPTPIGRSVQRKSSTCAGSGRSWMPVSSQCGDWATSRSD
jgi:hypothetical protein